MTAATTRFLPVHRRVTLADVARDCGLDKSTISKALNLPPDQFALTALTRKRIMESVARLGYRPSFQARSLARGETKVVGLVYYQSTPPSGVYSELQYTLAERLSAEGYSLQFFGLGDNPDHWGDLLGGQQIDAVAAVSRLPEAFGDVLVRSGLPAVLMNLDTDLPVDHVLVDDVEGTQVATRHLLDLGHRRIGFYGDTSTDSGVESHFSYDLRLQTYARIMTDAGLTPRTFVGNNPDALVVRLADAGVTGVVAFSHVSAMGLLHAGWKRGLRVPGDLSVVTFNNVFPVEMTIPPLTTVTTVGPDMGKAAADLLLERLRQRKSGQATGKPSHQRITLPETLVLRGSTAAPTTGE